MSCEKLKSVIVETETLNIDQWKNIIDVVKKCGVRIYEGHSDCDGATDCEHDDLWESYNYVGVDKAGDLMHYDSKDFYGEGTKCVSYEKFMEIANECLVDENGTDIGFHTHITPQESTTTTMTITDNALCNFDISYLDSLKALEFLKKVGKISDEALELYKELIEEFIHQD